MALRCGRTQASAILLPRRLQFKWSGREYSRQALIAYLAEAAATAPSCLLV